MGEIRVKLPYVRQKASGLYWEPSRRLKALGFRPRALGSDIGKATVLATEINAEAELALSGEDATQPPREGSIKWLSAKFKLSRRWQKLAPATQRGYRQCLDRIETWAGDKFAVEITRRAVKAWQESMEERAPAFAAATLRVFRVLMVFAKDQGYQVSLDEFKRLDLHTAGGNSLPWEDWEISAYLDQAKRMGRPSMALALMLGVSLGQREGDVLALPRSAYVAAEGLIYLRQRKTGARVGIPVLPELRREIELAPIKSTLFVASDATGRPYKEHHFRHLHRRICRAAGIDDARKFMELRHTAATRLGRAGCSIKLIQAVTGHRIAAMLDRYISPDTTMATAAIAKLEEHRNRTATETRRSRRRNGDGK